MAETEIRIQNARSHNLTGVSCRIPLRALTVITGVSGSGKSTLAFDTLYAEGQRRYVTSLSTYARQFLEQLPRPEVDSISHLPPAIAIEQRNRVTNARSTVGTATELLDYLRLLFARLGATHCPDCELPARVGGVAAVCERIHETWNGERLILAAPLTRRKGESPRDLRDRLAREGFTRLLDPEGRLVDVTECPLRELAVLRREARLVIDRLVLRGEESRVRLAESVTSAFARGSGEVIVIDSSGEAASFLEAFSCDGCGRVFPQPDPALFSFNSAMGACPDCQGFGRIAAIDFERVVPDRRRTLDEAAVAPFATRMGRKRQADLLRACRRLGISTDTPFEDLPETQQQRVFQGDENEGGDWYGVVGFFAWLERRRYKVQARVLIARYRKFDRCPACDGSRLSEDARCVRVAGRDLAEISRMTVGELRAWLEALELSPIERERTDRLLGLLRARVATVDTVGLSYVGLDRPVRTLSGGEAQRIQLATALGGSLTAALYVLDEPSIGLHARDVERLLAVLRTIRQQGNTVVVVEHAPEVVQAADHVIDLGPRAGRDGGRVVVEGSVASVRAHPESLTGSALRGELAPPSGSRRGRRVRGRLRIVGARENNLRDLSLELPLGQLVVVTGVSGAGKSTLVGSVIVGHLLSLPERGACRSVDRGSASGDVIVVDQTPASRSPRSNPATVSRAFDGIRRRFAETRQARALGVGPGWFSFNVKGGRCDHCEGSGEVVIDMHFLDDVRAPCDRCGGRRYRNDVLEIKLDGRSIVDVLALSIDAALEVFAADPRVAPRLEPLSQVGLGYLSLGQPLSTLSGGEHQRIRLALALAQRSPGALYVLDEPTTGLHPADIAVLLDCLDRLIAQGGSVIVVEHNLDVIRHADFVLDLGPDGGPGGGRVVAAGTPEEVARVRGSHTGAALRALA